jgi:hypothetical protein
MWRRSAHARRAYSAKTGSGTHTLRIDVLNDAGDRLRNMIYIDGFAITKGDVTPPPPGLTTDIGSAVPGTLVPFVTAISSLITDAETTALGAVVEAIPGTYTIELGAPSDAAFTVRQVLTERR